MSLLKGMQTLQRLLLHLYRYFSGKMVRNCTHFAHLIGIIPDAWKHLFCSKLCLSGPTWECHVNQSRLQPILNTSVAALRDMWHIIIISIHILHVDLY